MQKQSSVRYFFLVFSRNVFRSKPELLSVPSLRPSNSEMFSTTRDDLFDFKTRLGTFPLVILEGATTSLRRPRQRRSNDRRPDTEKEKAISRLEKGEGKRSKWKKALYMGDSNYSI